MNIVPRPLRVTRIPSSYGGEFIADSQCTLYCDEPVIEAAILKMFSHSIDCWPTDLEQDTPASTEAKKITFRLDGDHALGPEGYILSVSANHIAIAATTTAGLFYGAQSLHQLVVDGRSVPGCYIEDKPRFEWRGLMLDVARHSISVENILKLIDAMSLIKMNRLHLHLTDDQGWRMEVKRYPFLAEKGSIRSRSPEADEIYSGHYTQAKLRKIVTYAQERHITVVPEIEMPGHVKALLAVYPTFGCLGGPYVVRTTWGVDRDVLCIGNKNLLPFMKDVLAEVMDVFPGKYMHIGGDECPTALWEACHKCGEFMQNNHIAVSELETAFLNRVAKFITDSGRTPIGWSEVFKPGIAKEMIVMNWLRPELSTWAASRGHKVITASTTNYYLDYAQTRNTLRKAYQYDPVPLNASEGVIGVQGQMWTENIFSFEQACRMIFPRAYAIAETGWSVSNANDEYEDFVLRIKGVIAILKKDGIGVYAPPGGSYE